MYGLKPFSWVENRRVMCKILRQIGALWGIFHQKRDDFLKMVYVEKVTKHRKLGEKYRKKQHLAI